MESKDKKCGFAGLSDLVSKISGDDDAIISEPKLEAKPSPVTQASPSTPRETSRSESERRSTTSSSPIEKLPNNDEVDWFVDPDGDIFFNKQSKTIHQPIKTSNSGEKLGNIGEKWILGIIAIVVVIWLVNISGQTPKRPSYKPQVPQIPASDQLKPINKINKIKQPMDVEKVGFPLDFSGACKLQEILRYLCLYHGKVDGIIGPGSKKAINDFIEKEDLQIKNKIDTNLLDFLKKNYLNKSSPCLYSKQPENGYVFLSSGENIAPLQIRIPNYGKDFFVKLVNPYTNQSIKEFYIRAGQTVDTNVPLGTFHLKYAAGNIWIGRYNLFGLDTICSKANKEFIFEQIGEQVNGYTVELILQPGGNLRTSKINSEDF